MIDVHCHLNFHSFSSDYDAVIKSALEKGVTRIINTGTKLDSSKLAVDLAKQYSELFAIVGIHPHHADKIELGNNWIDDLEMIAKQSKVIGIGEIGLDYFSYKSNGIVDPKIQKEVFITQIELAHKLKLPLQIHNRLAGEDILMILKEKKHLLQTVPGMFHCFAGTKEVLKEALNLGFFIGFDGNITYPGLAPKETVELKELAKLTPLDRIVVETDSPYLTPIPHRGERNLPEYVILIGKFLSGVKEVSYDRIVEQTTQNVYTIFNKLS
ncbi:MAG: TatD family hydrolase [Candidatus Levybacteria bacterium]|nr:TatD family hydrolase [Candidatus Levybacteria bacterium]